MRRRCCGGACSHPKVPQPEAGAPVGSENSSGGSASGSAALCFPSPPLHPAPQPVVQRGDDDGGGCPSAPEAAAPQLSAAGSGSLPGAASGQLSASGGGSFSGAAPGQGRPAAEGRGHCGPPPLVTSSPHPPLGTSVGAPVPAGVPVPAGSPTANFGAANSMVDMAAFASMWGTFAASQPQLPSMPPQMQVVAATK